MARWKCSNSFTEALRPVKSERHGETLGDELVKEKNGETLGDDLVKEKKKYVGKKNR